MPDGFKSLKEIFKNDPALKKIRNVVKSSDVVNDFYKIFPDLEKIAKPERADGKTLIIKVENPAWRNELKFKETGLVEKINKHFNEKRITQIRFIG